jgi:hypothetical protein
MKPEQNAALRRDLEATVAEAKTFGYNPTRFHTELTNEPSPEALVYRYLFGKERVLDGFVRLWEAGRLDISIEYIAWKHSPPLPPPVKKRAEQYLDEVGFGAAQRRRHRWGYKP